MASETVLKAFLFTDIVGATALKGRIGDVKGAEAISRHDVLFRECLARFHGQEHENPGDSFFASFALPSEALRCALAFQKGMASLDSPEQLTARVGIHMGESVRSGSATGHVKLLGLAIDTAARVMELAQAGQILLTRHAFDSVRQQVATAPDGSQVEWRAHGPYRLKGVDHPIEIFEAGLPTFSPLTPPPNSPDAQRVVAPEDDETLGWRPAVGLPVPSRESWVLERKLGEGGFGEVWLARHAETEYVRAFKFCFHAERLRSLKREMKLFRLLTEVLGDRPDIARLYEVRLTEPPYFLEIEYTAGGNLSDWAETFGGVRNVPIARRLELVAQIGEALTAAHSVGIIHKDVKPANILIHEERDGRVQARLTDFGIGELLSKDKLVDIGMSMTAFETITRVDYDYRTLSGTQLYIAPELLAGQTPTLRADIYALGVLLYQMVIGDLNKPLAHGWEALVDDEVLREDIAACVAGNPEDRLPAADALSHRLRSLAKRRAARRAENRRRSLLRFSSAVAAVLLVIAAGSGVGLWQVELARRDAVAAHETARMEQQRAVQAERQAQREAERARNEALRAERARADAVAAEVIAQREKRRALEAEREARAEAERATREALRAERVMHFLQDMLAAANPSAALGRDVTVREVLEQAAADIDELSDEPAAAASIHATIGRSYAALGLYQAAGPHMARALELRRAALGEDDPDTLRAMSDLGVLTLHQGSAAEAEAMLRDALERQRKALGEGHADVAATLGYLGEAVGAQGRYADAEPLCRESLRVRETLLGPDDPETFEAANNLAAMLKEMGRLEDAEAQFRGNLEAQRRVLGDEHPQTLGTINNLAGTLKAMKRYDEAEALYREALPALRRVNGESHPHTLAAMNNLAGLLCEMMRFDQAEPLYRESLETLTQVLGDGHPTVLAVTHNLANLLREQGKLEEAAALYESLLADTDKTMPDHWYRWAFRKTYGECLTAMRRYDQAETVLREAFDGLQAAFGPDDLRTQGARESLIALYEASGRPERAATLRPAASQPSGRFTDGGGGG